MITYSDIQALGRPDLVSKRNEAAIAELLSAGRTKTISKEIGIGTVLSTLGSAGGPFLDGMVQLGNVDSNVKWAMKLLENASLDIGMAATRAQMQALADGDANIAPAVALLLNLAVIPDPVSAYEVAVALEGV